MVVAKYKENISWTSEVPSHITVKIYDKEKITQILEENLKHILDTS